MNKQEFLHILQEDMKGYLSNTERSLASWYLAATEHSDRRFNQEYDREHPKAAPKGETL